MKIRIHVFLLQALVTFDKSETSVPTEMVPGSFTVMYGPLSSFYSSKLANGHMNVNKSLWRTTPLAAVLRGVMSVS